MSFWQFLIQQTEFTSKLIELTALIIGTGITVLIEILIAKYLIRYGIRYFFQQKTIYESKKEIDQIQQDIIKDHGENKNKSES